MGVLVNPDKLRLEVYCDVQVADELRGVLNSDSQPRFIERRGLSGDAAWIVIATLSAQVLPHVLDFLDKLLNRSRVKRIKVDGVEIENPSPEDLEKLRRMLGTTLGHQHEG